jgi:hypothetical protein
MDVLDAGSRDVATHLDAGRVTSQGSFTLELREAAQYVHAHAREAEMTKNDPDRTPLSNPVQRTEWNVRDADAALI